MRVIVEMEIETEDYGGKEFKREIQKLIADIDTDTTRLTKFKMYAKDYDERDYDKDIDWQEK